MTRRRALPDEAGSAAVELVLMLPLMLLLLFGSFEAGNFIWSHHKLVEAVRNGARFASRLDVPAVCDGTTPVISPTTVDEIKLLTRTGQIGDAAQRPLVIGWTDDQIDVTVSCGAFVDTGIYSELEGAGPVVTVTATGVPYPSLFDWLGIFNPDIRMTARSSAAVIGL